MLHKALPLLLILLVILHAPAEAKREKIEDEVIQLEKKLNAIDREIEQKKEEITKVEKEELSTVNQLNAIDKKLSAFLISLCLNKTKLPRKTANNTFRRTNNRNRGLRGKHTNIQHSNFLHRNSKQHKNVKSARIWPAGRYINSRFPGGSFLLCKLINKAKGKKAL